MARSGVAFCAGLLTAAWLAPAAVILTPMAVAAETRPLRDVIDAAIEAAWQREQITPADPADDATFLRRVYLDLCGSIPTLDETKAFLAAADPNKRAALVDRLLDDPRHAEHLADRWDLLLFGRRPSTDEVRNRPSFRRWLREQFAQNVPYDKLVLALLKAEGNTVEQGAPMYLAQYTRRPEDAAETVTQTFLGVQLQCARCHDHPFEPWTQTDFYGLAAFFARLDRVGLGKSGEENKFAVGEKNRGEVLFSGPAIKQEPGKKGEPVKPKFLGGEPLAEPDPPAEPKEEKFKDNEPPPAPAFSRKNMLADWIVAPGNKYFARATANRWWAELLGRGLVHPIDNLSESNPASHPELLGAMAEFLVEHKFDVKLLLRELCNSRTYQLAAVGEVTEAMPRWFQRARCRPLSAEELITSWRIATNYDAVLAASGKSPPPGQRFYGVTGDYMLRFFGEPANGVGDFQGGLHEHLYLSNGEVGNLISTEKGSLHQQLVKSEAPPAERVEQLFLAVLSRPPQAEETTQLVTYVDVKDGANERWREAIWALLTCSEFRFNH